MQKDEILEFLQMALKKYTTLLCIVFLCGCSTSKTQPEATALAETPVARANKIFSIGFQLWQEGVFDAAVITFKKGLTVDPLNGSAHYYLGESLLRLNHTLEAVTHLERAVLYGGAPGIVCRAKLGLAALKHGPISPDKATALAYEMTSSCQ